LAGGDELGIQAVGLHENRYRHAGLPGKAVERVP
jgi:hypothetical protein